MGSQPATSDHETTPPAPAPAPGPALAGPRAERLLALQRNAGNRAVGRMLARWTAPPVPDADDVAKEAAKTAIETFRSMGEGTEEEVKEHRALDGGERGPAAGRGDGLVALRGQGADQHPQDGRVVVDDQDAVGHPSVES